MMEKAQQRKIDLYKDTNTFSKGRRKASKNTATGTLQFFYAYKTQEKTKCHLKLASNKSIILLYS